MIDFYLISDLSTNINSVVKEDFLGALSLEEHKALRSILNNPLGGDIHPFKDTWLCNSQVRLLHQRYYKIYESFETYDSPQSKALIKLLNILQIALDQNAGIVAFCD